MRIIGGSLKGRRFQPPSNFKGRPTTDYARESLFNILQHKFEIQDADTFDLFAGSGAVSYELASRGASTVRAIELSGNSCSFIRTTALSFGITQIIPVKADVFSWLAQTRETWDIVFADPPYDLPRLKELPKLIKEKGIVRKSGIFIMEHGPDHSFAGAEGLFDERTYGHVNFSFFNFDEA